MAAYDTLRAAIDSYIKANGNKEITGTVLNDILNAMVSALGADTRFAGVAVPSTNPGNPEGNVVYFASQAGTYSNFGGIVLPLGIHILVWNGTAWTSQTWFSVDNTPTQNSQNLATSGGILQAIVDAVGVERLRAIGVEVTSCSFDSNTKKISFFNSANSTLFQLDASAFIIDGMISDVKIEDGNLVIQFNTDAGKQDIEIPLTDIFDPANYYTKTAIDALLDLYYTKTETNALLTAINNKLADGCLYRGMAEPTTNPPTPTTKVFYIATKAGTYTNFGNIAVTEGITILKYDGSNWSKEQISYSDGVFDISAYNGTSYANLSAALGTNGANIPQNLRKGGMSVKFIQTPDNNYIQARLMANSFTTDITKWQVVDDEPTAGSKNLVESGGIVEYVNKDYIHQKSLLMSDIYTSTTDNYLDITRVIRGFYISDGSGTIVQNVKGVCSGFIYVGDIAGSGKVTVSGYTAAQGLFLGVASEAKYVPDVNTYLLSNTSRTIDIPAAAKYIFISLVNPTTNYSDYSTVKISKSNIAATEDFNGKFLGSSLHPEVWEKEIVTEDYLQDTLADILSYKDIVMGKYIDQNNNVADRDGYGYMSYIDVSSINSIEYYGYLPDNQVGVLVYDENYNLLDFWGQSTAVGARTINISSATGKKWMRVNVKLDSDFYVKNHENENYILKKEIVNLNSVSEFDQSKLFGFLGNTMMKATKKGFGINSSGQEVAAKDWECSDYINIEGVQTLKWKSGSDEGSSTYKLVIYDKNYNLIEYFSTLNGAERTINIADYTNSACYVRASFVLYENSYLKDGNGEDLIIKTSIIKNGLDIKTINKHINIFDYYNRNFIENAKIILNGSLVFANGVCVSEIIPVTNTTFTWNYGTGVTWVQDSLLVVFDVNGNVLDFYGLATATNNSRTITLSGDTATNAAYIMMSFAKDAADASLVQGSNIWIPKITAKEQNNKVVHIEVATYNVGYYREGDTYQSDWLKQLKGYMNGIINKDILFVQEDKDPFVKGGHHVKSYETYFKQFYPYRYSSADNLPSIYSKYPLKNTRNIVFNNGQISRTHAFAEVEICGKTIALCSAHLDISGYQEDECAMLVNQFANYDYVIVGGDFNVEVPQSDTGYCQEVYDTFIKAGYKTANWGYWGNIHTQTDVYPDEHTVENQIDSFVVKGFDINSFKVIPNEYPDHKPCVSDLNFSLF